MDADFEIHEIVDSAGRDTDVHVSVDRVEITRSFLVDICGEDDRVSGMTISAIIQQLNEVLGE